MTILLEPQTLSKSNDYHDLHHYYCADCFPETGDRVLAYCGADVTNSEEIPEEKADSVDCVVCLDLEYCPICDPPVE